MPMRYFFNILDADTYVLDPLGSKFDSVEAARAEALACARELIGERMRRGHGVPDDWMMEVLDAKGQIVDIIPAMRATGLHLDPIIRAFDVLPHPYLLVTRDFGILHANRAYLDATYTDLPQIRYRSIFEAFPDNPGDPEADGVRNLSASLSRVLNLGAPDLMPIQRYDIRNRNRAWEERHWSPKNLPVLDEHGDVSLIIHHAENATRRVKPGRATRQRT